MRETANDELMAQRKPLWALSKAGTRIRISERAYRWLFSDSFCLTARGIITGRTENMQGAAVLSET